MRITHLLHVGNQLIGDLAIGEPAIAFFRNAPPGAEMDFVDGDRLGQPFAFPARLHPCIIVPAVAVE